MSEFSNNRSGGFVKARGEKLVDGWNRELLLRGFGLGNWFLPEGYMWKFPAAADRPRRIESLLTEFLGESGSRKFWNTYRDLYITEADIRLMAEWGSNSVRLPLNSRYLLTENGELDEQTMGRIDRFLDLCRKYNLYVVLDLHGAPGGQTGANIDDSANDQPELFLDDRNRRITIDLWHHLAERYADESIIAGYDLLNEPLPNWFSMYNDQVMPLYKEIIQAIREVDKNHMIILEGVHWASDWSIFDEVPDSNLMLQFHKYWNNPDIESIQPYLDKRREWGVPIYMGEGGENNCDWYTGAFQMFEDLDISWNFWTWKKLGTGNSPVSIPVPEGWNLITEYLEGGPRPDMAMAQAIFQDYLANLSTPHCDIRSDVFRAIFRRAPFSVPAIFYGYKGPDEDFGPGPGTGDYEKFRRGDGQSFGFLTAVRTEPNFHHDAGEPWSTDDKMYLELQAGRWVCYDFEYGEILPGDDFEVEIRFSGVGELDFSFSEASSVRISSESEIWASNVLKQMRPAESSSGRITVKCIAGKCRLERLDIRPKASR